MLPVLADFGHIIGQSIYSFPVITYLLETETFSIAEYQLKCCSVANDAAPDCRMVRSGAACYGQGHQQDWHGRLHTYVRVDGQHFEHLH